MLINFCFQLYCHEHHPMPSFPQILLHLMCHCLNFHHVYIFFMLLRTDSCHIPQINILLCFRLVGIIWKIWQKQPNLLMPTTMMKSISSSYNLFAIFLSCFCIFDRWSETFWWLPVVDVPVQKSLDMDALVLVLCLIQRFVNCAD